MKDKVFSILQRVGRSFMLPIAILPVAGLFLGIGGSFTNETMLQTYGLMSIMAPAPLSMPFFRYSMPQVRLYLRICRLFLQWVLPLAWQNKKKKFPHFLLQSHSLLCMPQSVQ